MDSPETGLMPLGERIQEALEAETNPAEQLRVARIELLDRVTRAPRRTRTTTRLRYAGLALAMLVVAAVITRSWSRPISFETRAGERGVGDVLEAPQHDPLRVDFSEGSRMLLHSGSRARVLETEAAGARVLLESGVAEVSIVHRMHRAIRWRFEAGPFQVLVTGTKFELGWQPAAQSLSLTMKSGRVVLSGSCLPSPRVVERGASLRLSCADVASAPHRALPQVAQPATTAAAAPAPAQPAAPATTAGPPAHAAKPAPPSFEASCEAAGKAELVASANRERLAGHVARARTALLVLRRRFPDSSEAGTAAFALGRMAFDQRADYREAARWFSTYLAEQPNGPLMGDAAGRLLEAHERAGDLAAARRDAQAYLRRFPDGPYAKQAKRILAD